MIRNTLYAMLLLGTAGLAGCACHTSECGTSACDAAGTVRAKQIVIVDEKGRDRIFMGPVKVRDKEVVGIVLLDENGQRRVMSGTGQDGNAAVVILDQDGKPRIITGSFGPKVGAGTLYMDNKGGHRVSIGTDDHDGEAHVEVLDGDGNEIHSFEAGSSRHHK
jgi:hypothetical protein